MSDAPKVSVLTPTTRPDGLPMVADCLAAQTLTDFEWVVCSPPGTRAPEDLVAYLKARVPAVRFVQDPPRREGDFYRLNGAFNALVRAARAPLLVFACDWIHFGPDALGLFRALYDEAPTACASSWGHHYRKVVNGRPEVLWNTDGRLEGVGDDAAMPAEHMELSLASLPRALVEAVGGFDEDYDRVAGNSEKDLALRMEKAGAKFFLALAVEHRIYTHPKADSAATWDRKYREACDLLHRHAREVREGTRLKVPYLERD